MKVAGTSWLPHAIVSAFCIWIAWFVSPELVGYWESSSFFHTFAPEDFWLSTAIHPRANIGGYEYAIIDLSRHVVDLFGASLRTIRIVPILLGLASLLLGYYVFKRFCRPLVALATVLLLASNPVFLLFQHQMLVSIVTFAALMLCVHGFFLVNRDQPDSRALWIFAAGCAAAALHYQIGRYCMVAIVLFWCARGIRVWPRVDLSQWEVLDRQARQKFLRFAKRFLFLLVILNPINPLLLFNPSFLSPTSAEHAGSSIELAESVLVNAPLIARSFLGGGPFFGSYATDIINAVPFPLINIPLALVAAIGCVAIWANRKPRLALFAFYLFGLVTIPLTLSSIFGRTITLSPHRMLYILIPTFFFISVGLEWLTVMGDRVLQHVSSFAGKAIIATALGVCILVGVQTREALDEQERFSEFIRKTPCAMDDTSKSFGCYSEGMPTARAVTPRSDGSDDLDWPFDTNRTAYTSDQIPAYRYAAHVSSFVREHQTLGEVLVVEVPITELQTSPNSHIARFNSRKWLLALYLSDQDHDVNIVVPYPGKSALTSRQQIAGSLVTRLATANKYRSKYVSHLSSYPVPFDGSTGSYQFQDAESVWAKTSRKLREMDMPRLLHGLTAVGLATEQAGALDDSYHFRTRSFGTDSDTPIYITTTQSESRYLAEIFKGNQEYKLVRFSLKGSG